MQKCAIHRQRHLFERVAHELAARGKLGCGAQRGVRVFILEPGVRSADMKNAPHQNVREAVARCKILPLGVEETSKPPSVDDLGQEEDACIAAVLHARDGRDGEHAREPLEKDALDAEQERRSFLPLQEVPRAAVPIIRDRRTNVFTISDVEDLVHVQGSEYRCVATVWRQGDDHNGGHFIFSVLSVDGRTLSLFAVDSPKARMATYALDGECDRVFRGPSPNAVAFSALDLPALDRPAKATSAPTSAGQSFSCAALLMNCADSNASATLLLLGPDASHREQAIVIYCAGLFTRGFYRCS